MMAIFRFVVAVLRAIPFPRTASSLLARLRVSAARKGPLLPIVTVTGLTLALAAGGGLVARSGAYRLWRVWGFLSRHDVGVLGALDNIVRIVIVSCSAKVVFEFFVASPVPSTRPSPSPPQPIPPIPVIPPVKAEDLPPTTPQPNVGVPITPPSGTATPPVPAGHAPTIDSPPRNDRRRWVSRALGIGTIAMLGGLGFVAYKLTWGRTYYLEDPHFVDVDGRVRQSRVYRVDVPRDNVAEWLIFSVAGPTLSPMGIESGIDLDAIVVSTHFCQDAACVASIDARGGVDAVLSPGAIEGTQDPGVRLVGTTPGGGYIDASSTLDLIDGDREQRTGYVSLGTGGRVLIHFTPAITDKEYVYLAIVGKPVFEHQSGDDTLAHDARPPVFFFFRTDFNFSDEPRSSPDVRVTSARQTRTACVRLSEYRAALEAGRAAAIACLDEAFPLVTRALRAVDLERRSVQFSEISATSTSVAIRDHR